MAIYQGTQLLSILHQEAEITISHDQTKRATYLTGLFSRIHHEMFHYWKEQAIVNHRPGTIADPDKRKSFRETIERLVLDGELNQHYLVAGSFSLNSSSIINKFLFHLKLISANLWFEYFPASTTRQDDAQFSYKKRFT